MKYKVTAILHCDDAIVSDTGITSPVQEMHSKWVEAFSIEGAMDLAFTEFSAFGAYPEILSIIREDQL